MCNENLNKVFNYSDPNLIAELLMPKMNIILEDITPRRLDQYNKTNKDFVDQQTIKAKEEVNEQLRIAIKLNDIEDWRCFRPMKNQLSKFVNKVQQINQK